MIASSIKAAVVKDNARQAGDTGSPEVQVALLTARINELMPHFKTHAKEITTILNASNSTPNANNVARRTRTIPRQYAIVGTRCPDLAIFFLGKERE